MMRTESTARGFTLIETLIVVGLLGIIMVALSATFGVIVRSHPPTEATVDDARTTLGLTTYLPEDVDSAPVAGIDRPNTRAGADSQVTGCAGGATDGFSLLRLTWTETVGATTTYIANYRLVPAGTGSRIARYYCVNGGVATITNMTSQLPAVAPTWDPGEPPVSFVASANGVDVELTTGAGEDIKLEARSNNPAETLPPEPPQVFPPIPPGNHAPTAQSVSTTTTVNTPKTIALTISDPDVGDGLVVIPPAPTVSAATPGWTAAVSGSSVTVTPPAAAPAGEVATLSFQARDPYGQLSATATVTVTLVAAPVNHAPTAGTVNGNVVAGTPLLINLPVADSDGDPLTITIGSTTGGLTASVDQATRVMTVISDGSNESPPSFQYTVTDGRGGTATGTVSLTVTICKVTSLSPATTSVPLKNGNQRLTTDVVYTVAYTGPCTNLVLVFDHDGSSSTADDVLSFASSTTVTVQGHPSGLSNWSLGNHNMMVRNGVTGPNLTTATLTTT